MVITQAQQRLIEASLHKLWKDYYNGQVRIQMLNEATSPNANGDAYGFYLAWEKCSHAGSDFAEKFGERVVEASQIAAALTRVGIETDLIKSDKDEIWLANNPLVINQFTEKLREAPYMSHYKHFIEHCFDDFEYLLKKESIER